MTLPLTPSLEEARAELAGWIEAARTAWNANMAVANWTLPATESDNRNIVDLGSTDAERPFLCWELDFGGGGAASMGQTPLGRQWGQLRLAAKVKEGSGTAQALRLLSYVIPYIENKDGTYVHTQVADVISGGAPKGGWYAVVALFTFRIDRVVATVS